MTGTVALLMLMLGTATQAPVLSSEPPDVPPVGKVAPQPARTLSEKELLSDEPPATSYSLPEQSDAAPSLGPDPQLVEQLGRTIVALLFVIALIYLCTKLIPRFFKNLPIRSSNPQLKILERAQLDQKHAVVLLQVDDNTRVLLGTGDGVHLLTTLTVPQSAPFRSTLSEAQRDVQPS